MPYKDPERQRAFQRERARRRRAEFMAGLSCERCGSTDDLTLHHRDPREKTSHRIWQWAESRIREEMAKCEILCRPCHVGHHARLLERHGTRARYKRGCRCGLCRLAKQNENLRYRQRKAAA